MKSGFKSDAQGFLVGEVVESGRDLMRAQQQSMVIWKTIRTDVKAIARAVGAQASNNIRARVAHPVGRSAAVQRTASARTAVVVAQPRAGNGRFMAGARPVGGGGGGRINGGGDSTSRMFGRMNDTLGKVANSLQAADNIDPTVNALKEVKDVVSPLGRGLFSLFGRTAERKKEAWYRKFLRALTPGSQKAQQQASGGGGFFGLGGGGGLLGSLLGTAGGSMAGGLLGTLLGKGKGLMKSGGKLLGRIPLLGALVAGGGALASIFGGGTRDEKYKGVGEAGGMFAGGLAGAKGGALLGAFAGPIGIAVGGFLGGVGGALLGEKFGAKVGEWTKTLVDSDIPGKVVEGWKATTAFIGAAWDSIAADAKTAWGAITTTAGEWLDAAKSGIESVGKTLSDAGNAVNDWIKAKTGIDVKANVGKAVDKVGEVAGAAWEKTKSAASAGWSAAKGYGAEAVDAAKAGAAAMVPNTVKLAYKAGVAATGTAMQAGGNAALVHKEGVAAGMGPKELANFMGQNDHESGNFGVLSEDLNYSSVARIRSTFGKNKAIAGMADAEVAGLVNNPEALANLVYGGRVGNTEAGDGFKFRGRGFTQLTGRANYTAAGKAIDLDLVNNPDLAADPANAARISAWYWKKNVAARGAGEDVTAATKAINGGLNGLSDRQKKIAEWEARVNAGGTRAQVASVSLPASAPLRIPSPVPANIPKPVEVKEPAMPLNSAVGVSGSINVSIPETVGQDVGDRGIAHVVSGGLGGGTVL